MNTQVTLPRQQRKQFDHRRYRRFAAIDKADRRWPGQHIEAAPQWCSVDLRDGNQALIEPMTVEQKQHMWQLLLNLGFKQIEVGFPAASQPDYDFVRWLIEHNQIPDDVTIQVLVQARDELIERTFEALQGARKAIVHLYNSTSPVQRERVFCLDKDGIVDIARRGAHKVKTEAQRYPATEWVFQYSPESFSTTEIDFAVEICNTVIDVWQPKVDDKVIINLPATVEASLPNAFADMVEYFCDHVQHRDCLVISIHTHNDRGCAVAAAELALLAGADRIEGTLLGNGERTGNMDIVTMAMNLYSQGIDPELDFSNPDDVIATVEACTRIKTHPRHPWVGELVYTAFSGSHQDAIRKCLTQQDDDEPWDVAYLPIDPQDLGRSYQSVIRVNSQSGKGGAAYLLEQQLGIELPRWLQVELAAPVQQLAERQQGELEAQQVLKLFRQHFMPRDGRFHLAGYQVDRQGSRHHIQASISDEHDMLLIHGHGNGAISAFADAMHKATGIDIQVLQFEEQATEHGSDAAAMAMVQASVRGTRACGVAKDQDTLAASLQAILRAVNSAVAQ
ncbi:2-isopropylmalate synthase [Bacterioplanes sanyensis]|uniref:2-isopropylmalate synthase n=1 Tax=Bacterioplanes sanyensis TaxID=1249553 RepID=A0A222FQ56_9GAMM|nr:2-isopropylmalate synthase [Bacterioplanes sanyensis]ASP40889.1 2-isopropylmalate synthase [Bacterioplanes sanyensis]